ncbi:MAG TPA: hypothetical protein VF145_13925, partial [Chitinophagaceae bacterium]
MPGQQLQQRFYELNAGRSAEAVQQAWKVIQAAYLESHRCYHTLNHLSDLFRQMDQVKPMLKNVPVVAMAVYYHDIIYQPGSADNEERSAAISTETLHRLGWKERDVREVAAYIRSTKTHEPDPGVLNAGDLDAFLD